MDSGGPAPWQPHDDEGVATSPGLPAPHPAEPDDTAPAQHDVTKAAVSPPLATDEADASATISAGDEDDATTTLVTAAPQGPGGHALPPPYDEDEVTTILVHASPTGAAEPGGHAVSPPYDEDEVTTVLVTASSPLAAGLDALGHAPSYEEDEVTTVVVTTLSPDAAGPENLTHPTHHDEDEVTTVLMAAPEERAAGPRASDDDEEVTTVLVAAAGPGTGAPAETGPNAIQADGGDDRDDEPTTIVVAAEPDERTTVAHAGPAMPPSAGEAADPHTSDQLSAWSQAHAGDAPHAVGHAAVPSPEADEPVTEVIQVPHPPGGKPSDPDRQWFDSAFSHFVTALRQDEAGRPRPQEERHALAAAARDTITRVAMQTVRSGEGWATDTVLHPDQLLANTYTVRSLIARGGIGEIYRVRHRDLKTEHAIKILLPHYALDATMQTLMLDEARLLRRVQHEAVVRAQDLLRDADGRPMLVMDYIRGRTLASRLRESQLSPPEVLALTRRLAEGLSAIHATGIVHQDISPDNIILAEAPGGTPTATWTLPASIRGPRRSSCPAGRRRWTRARTSTAWG